MTVPGMEVVTSPALLARGHQTTDALRAWQNVLALAQTLKKPEAKRKARAQIINILHRTYQLRYRVSAYRRSFEALPPDLEAHGLTPEALSPARLRTAT